MSASWLPASTPPTEKPSGWVEGETCGEESPPVESPTGWVTDFPDCDSEEPEPEPEPLDPDLIGWWKFNQASGSTNWPDEVNAVDLVRSGSGDNGLVSAQGYYLKAVHSINADPLSDLLETAGRTAFLGVSDLTKGLTVAVRIKITGGLLDFDNPLLRWHLFENGVSANEQIVEVAYDDLSEAVARFRSIGSSPDIRRLGSGVTWDERFHLLVAVYNPTTHKIGISVDGGSVLFGIGTKTRLWGAVGKMTIPSMDFYGDDERRHYDDVRLWQKALTNAEILALYFEPPEGCSLVNNGASITTPLNTQFSGQLSDYITNPDSESLSYEVLQVLPSHGIVVLQTATGAFSYTPGNGYSGSDQFSFRVWSSTCTSNIASVNITITP